MYLIAKLPEVFSGIWREEEEEEKEEEQEGSESRSFSLHADVREERRRERKRKRLVVAKGCHFLPGAAFGETLAKKICDVLPGLILMRNLTC